MNQFDRFREVTREIHDLIGIEPQEPLDGQHGRWVTDLEIDGIAMAIMYSPAEHPDSLCLVCAFGTMPEARKQEIVASLLRFNFTLSISGNASFCINPTTGEVLFVTRLGIMQATSRLILSTLQRISEQARLWRATYFLGMEFESSDVLALCASSMRA